MSAVEDGDIGKAVPGLLGGLAAAVPIELVVAAAADEPLDLADDEGGLLGLIG